jgi:hypothetical protein
MSCSTAPPLRVGQIWQSAPQSCRVILTEECGPNLFRRYIISGTVGSRSQAYQYAMEQAAGWALIQYQVESRWPGWSPTGCPYSLERLLYCPGWVTYAHS